MRHAGNRGDGCREPRRTTCERPRCFRSDGAPACAPCAGRNWIENSRGPPRCGANAKGYEDLGQESKIELMRWALDQFVPPGKSEFGFTDTRPLIKVILVSWCLLLIPWLPFAAVAGMAFDGGDRWQAYVLVWSVWLYPVTLFIAFVSRQKIPSLVLLPIVNVIAFWISGFSKP